MTKAARKSAKPPARSTGRAKAKAPAATKEAPAAPAPPRDFTLALCFVGEPHADVWGMSTRDRLIRQFAREGVTEIVTLNEAAHRNSPLILLDAAAVIDQPLVPVLTKRPNLALTEPPQSGGRIVAITTNSSQATLAAEAIANTNPPDAALKLLMRDPGNLGATFWKGLRKREVPYALIVTEANRKAVEWRMFMGTYKGATDLVTKHVWPRPAYHVTRWLASTRITPNMVTAVGAVCVILAFWLFLEGQFISGLAAAWMMTFLDTVDGKLARTTLTSSKWGDIFDHGIDLIHPPFWYIAWGYGLAAAGFSWSPAFLWTVLAAIFIGYVLQRLMEGAAIKWLGIEIHIWRPIDTWFRKITARRNPNLLLMTLGAMIARPDWGLIAVAVWTVLCLVLHGIQLIQAFSARTPGEPLTSWMSEPVKSP